MAIGPVLIAYDGSEHAHAAIDQAAALLRPGQQAIVVSVWQPLGSIPFAQLAVIPADLAEAMGDHAQRIADEGAERARAAGFAAEPEAIGGDSIWHALIEFADEQDASLIVLGSRGHSGLRHAALGSVATAVVQRAKRPVFVGKAAGD